SLWSLGKLSESGHLNGAELKKEVLILLQQLVSKEDANLQALANSLWALGILLWEEEVGEELQIGIFSLLTNMFKNMDKLTFFEKDQCLKSIGLLRMDNQLDVEVLSSLIKSCKPQSMLTPRIIQSLVPHGKEYALEAFVDGFFVDILIPETKEIIEVDGKQHENHWQSCLD
ncbi:hypothetical protein, partial [Legionella yabuuchiae]|uniref:hypothetical protein n=1 Tax=Legionella yabuuchiae TaxID=376727 RepID=UPI0013EF9F41